MSQMCIYTVIAPYISVFVDSAVERYRKIGFIILVAREIKLAENLQCFLTKN